MCSSYLDTRCLGQWWRWRMRGCNVCHEDWWLRLCNTSSAGASWHWWRGPLWCVLLLHPCPWISGNANQADKSLSAQNLVFSRDKRAQLPPSPLAGREAAGPLTLAQAGAASPRPPHRNHKFTVGLLCSPPILRSGYLPRLVAYLGVRGWVRAMGELAVCRDQTPFCCWD